MTFILRNRWYAAALIAVAAALVFVPFIGNCPLFDWDEVNFAECAREMIVSNDYSHVQLNYRPFWEKPPLFIWLQAASMNLFGVNEFAARLPNALCSIVTLIVLFLAGSRFHSPRFGLVWVLCYAATLLPHLYFKSGLIDPWFNLFIFLALYNALFIVNNPHGRREIFRALFGGMFLGLAVLTKGPAALIIAGATLLLLAGWQRNGTFIRSLNFLLFSIATIVISCSWFIMEWIKGNADIITAFIDYQVRLFETGDAGHEGPWYYHLVVLLLGCFPVSLLFIAGYLHHAGITPFQRLMRRLMLCLFWTVLVLFSIVKTKIVHYSSLCYFPMTFIAALALCEFLPAMRWRKWQRPLYWIIAAIIGLAYVAVTLVEQIKRAVFSAGIINDKFAVDNLSADVHWTGIEPFAVLLFIAGSALIYRAVNTRRFRFFISGMLLQLSFAWLAIAFIIPRVELYTQHAAIAFYKSCVGRNCYVETHAFKSYAYLFYSQRKPSDYTNPEQLRYIEKQLDAMEKEGHSRLSSFATANLLWMEYGKIDRPAYIVAKSTSEQEVSEIPGMKKLYSSNGFCFFVRMPSN